MFSYYTSLCLFFIIAGVEFGFAAQISWLVPCIEDEECESFNNATCSPTGYCDCGPLKVCESPEVKIIANRIGGECDGVTKICNGEFSECVNAKCVCKEGFKPSEDRRVCITVLNTSCVRDEDCYPLTGAHCMDNSCSCFEDHIAIEKYGCLPKIGKFGDVCSDDRQCRFSFGEFAACRERCGCLEGYKQSNGTCIKHEVLGNPCETAEDCGENTEIRCIKGRCRCKMGDTCEKSSAVGLLALNVLLLVPCFLIRL